MSESIFKVLVKEKFSLLSLGQKKVATYISENLEECVFKTAQQIGEKADVSETTVIRLSYALGLLGFSDLQACIQKEFIQSKKPDCVAPAINNSQDQHIFTRIIEKEINILKNMLLPLNIEEISKAVETIIAADQILIVGHRASSIAAYWFSNTLSSIRSHIDYCSPTADFYGKFCNLTERSLVIAFSFPRYATETLTIAECTKENGINLIAVTDRFLSPVGRIADVVLATEQNVESGSHSIASVVSLLNLVMVSMVEKNKKVSKANQQKLEEMYAKYNVFIE